MTTLQKIREEIEQMRKINIKSFESGHIKSDNYHGRTQAQNHILSFLDTLEKMPKLNKKNKIMNNKLMTLDGLIERLTELREIAGEDCPIVLGSSFDSKKERMKLTMVSLDTNFKNKQHVAILAEKLPSLPYFVCKETKDAFDKAFSKFEEQNPDWENELTDSSYYEFAEWYDEFTGVANNESLSNKAFEFANYVWRIIKEPNKYNPDAILQEEEVDLGKYYPEFLQKEWFVKSKVRTVSEMMEFTAKHFYNLGKQSSDKDCPKIKGWVARDEAGRIFFGQEKPHKSEGARQGVGFWTGYGEFMELPSYMFPDLKWEDEPRKCELNIRLL